MEFYSKYTEHIDVNQGLRPYIMLAELEDGRVLIEYEMPNGTTTLKIVPPKVWIQSEEGRLVIDGWRCKNLAYSAIPQYWVDAIVAAGNEGMLEFAPQQASLERIREYIARYRLMVKKAHGRI